MVKKMSKSYNNVIDIFLSDKKLRKQIMSITTDSLDISDPKDPNQCTVFKLYSLIADETQIKNLKTKYISGGYGYGQVKQELFDLICAKFKVEREKFNFYMKDTTIIEKELIIGAEKAREIANNVLTRVRKNIGY